MKLLGRLQLKGLLLFLLIVVGECNQVQEKIQLHRRFTTALGSQSQGRSNRSNSQHWLFGEGEGEGDGDVESFMAHFSDGSDWHVSDNNNTPQPDVFDNQLEAIEQQEYKPTDVCINFATDKEIVEKLGLSEEAASDFVRLRNKHGVMKTKAVALELLSQATKGTNLSPVQEQKVNVSCDGLEELSEVLGQDLSEEDKQKEKRREEQVLEETREAVMDAKDVPFFQELSGTELFEEAKEAVVDQSRDASSELTQFFIGMVKDLLTSPLVEADAKENLKKFLKDTFVKGVGRKLRSGSVDQFDSVSAAAAAAYKKAEEKGKSKKGQTSPRPSAADNVSFENEDLTMFLEIEDTLDQELLLLQVNTPKSSESLHAYLDNISLSTAQLINNALKYVPDASQGGPSSPKGDSTPVSDSAPSQGDDAFQAPAATKTGAKKGRVRGAKASGDTDSEDGLKYYDARESFYEESEQEQNGLNRKRSAGQPLRQTRVSKDQKGARPVTRSTRNRVDAEDDPFSFIEMEALASSSSLSSLSSAALARAQAELAAGGPEGWLENFKEIVQNMPIMPLPDHIKMGHEMMGMESGKESSQEGLQVQAGSDKKVDDDSMVLFETSSSASHKISSALSSSTSTSSSSSVSTSLSSRGQSKARGVFDWLSAAVSAYATPEASRDLHNMCYWSDAGRVVIEKSIISVYGWWTGDQISAKLLGHFLGNKLITSCIMEADIRDLRQLFAVTSWRDLVGLGNDSLGILVGFNTLLVYIMLALLVARVGLPYIIPFSERFGKFLEDNGRAMASRELSSFMMLLVKLSGIGMLSLGKGVTYSSKFARFFHAIISWPRKRTLLAVTLGLMTVRTGVYFYNFTRWLKMLQEQMKPQNVLKNAIFSLGSTGAGLAKSAASSLSSYFGKWY